MKIKIAIEAYQVISNFSIEELENEIWTTQIAVNSRSRYPKDAIVRQNYITRLSVLKLFLQLRKDEISLEEMESQVTTF